MKIMAGRRRTLGRGTLLTVGLTWLLAAPLAAQTAPAGTRVRVTAPEHMEQPCVGRVLESADPLVVRERTGVMHEIPIRQVELLEVSRGRDHNGPPTVAGAVIGGLIGAVVGWTSYTQEHPARPCDAEEDPLCIGSAMGALSDEISGRSLRAAVGIMAGAPVGGLVGYALTPERWVRIWERDVHAGASIAPHGIIVRVGGSHRR